MEFLLECLKPLTKKEYKEKAEEEKNNLHLINRITYLRKEDLAFPPIEQYQNVYKSLDANNYYTYMFYLQNLEKTDASIEEKEYYRKLIKNLIKEEQTNLKKNITLEYKNEENESNN